MNLENRGHISMFLGPSDRAVSFRMIKRSYLANTLNDSFLAEKVSSVTFVIKISFCNENRASCVNNACVVHFFWFKNPVHGWCREGETARGRRARNHTGTGSSPTAAFGIVRSSNGRSATWDVFSCGRARIPESGEPK